jgi:hypothetical protein
MPENNGDSRLYQNITLPPAKAQPDWPEGKAYNHINTDSHGELTETIHDWFAVTENNFVKLLFAGKFQLVGETDNVIVESQDVV